MTKLTYSDIAGININNENFPLPECSISNNEKTSTKKCEQKITILSDITVKQSLQERMDTIYTTPNRNILDTEICPNSSLPIEHEALDDFNTNYARKSSQQNKPILIVVPPADQLSNKALIKTLVPDVIIENIPYDPYEINQVFTEIEELPHQERMDLDYVSKSSNTSSNSEEILTESQVAQVVTEVELPHPERMDLDYVSKSNM